MISLNKWRDEMYNNNSICFYYHQNTKEFKQADKNIKKLLEYRKNSYLKYILIYVGYSFIFARFKRDDILNNYVPFWEYLIDIFLRIKYNVSFFIRITIGRNIILKAIKDFIRYIKYNIWHFYWFNILKKEGYYD